MVDISDTVTAAAISGTRISAVVTCAVVATICEVCWIID